LTPSSQISTLPRLDAFVETKATARPVNVNVARAPARLE
jgi:hypothetical protein